MASSIKQRRNTLTALFFLAPNIIGVLTFVVFPVLFSILLAFTNWDLRKHNMFKDESLEFVGFENFVRLLTEADFMRYLGNTLFLMMGIPVSIGGALFAALLLSKDSHGGNRRVFAWLATSAVLVASCAMLAAVGMAGTGMVILLTGVAAGIMITGVFGGMTVYRTLFYTPHFVAGVATFLLWKKLYNPQTGPINAALQPVLDVLATSVNAVPPPTVYALTWGCLGLMLALAAWCMNWLRAQWRDGEIGTQAAIVPCVFVLLPTVIGLLWGQTQGLAWVLLIGLAAFGGWQMIQITTRGRDFTCPRGEGFGSSLMICLAVMVLQFIALGFAAVFLNLPGMAADGLDAPEWISNYDWAKPSLMIMGLWAAIGSNNMLLYLAALTNIPPELYEAADIDGASRRQRFWHVTWPQLAPTTFFISVMATIGGLQGGFEMARTMTQGGPAGATTTLSYFIYIEGFETGRLSFAAAVAWALFILVFGLTLFNWKFGNKYVND